MLEGWGSWCPWQTSSLSVLFWFCTHAECKTFRVVEAPSKAESLGRQVGCSYRFGLHAGCPSEGEIRESVRTREGRHSKNMAIC